VVQRQGPPAWVTDTVGPVREAARIRWGFTNESWRVVTVAGGPLVATRMAGPASAGAVLARGPAIAATLASVGISTPVPIAERSAPERAVIVSGFVAGRSGMELVGDVHGAATVGRLLGEAWHVLGRIDTTGLELDDLWARPADLAAAAGRWLTADSAALEPTLTTGIARRIEGLARLLEGHRPGFVHGDLVPANILVEGEKLAALLDLETVRLGARLLDAAWFRWIVRYHHPDVAHAAWRAFAGASNVDDARPQIATLLDVLPLVRILEILSQPTLEAGARVRWLDQLAACLRYTGTGG
jgi:aminoglycoside phosphotransferase (APT) family kinase protein